MIVLSDKLHAHSAQIIAVVESVIAQYPVLGAISFVALAMVSAMLAFFSSAIIAPIGVYAWGAVACCLLLWLGWLLGGVVSFWIGRYFGRAVVAQIIGEARLDSLTARFGRHASFTRVVLFQAALPSEVPGYVLGTINYPFWRYMLALGLVELPYAVGTVVLGASFLERDTGRFVLVGIAALTVVAIVYYLGRRFSERVRQ